MNLSDRTSSIARHSSSPYDSRFFSNASAGSLNSARVVLQLLFELHRPESVLDIGCGTGAWLTAAGELGAKRLVGLDGPWVAPAALLNPNIAFTHVDLESLPPPRERYDLSISVEVAEHLSAATAARFVAHLCAASDTVVFSAAICKQGGVRHINEQWPSYWANLFNDSGYSCHDLFRPHIWGDTRVERWYRQNTFLYIKRDHPLHSKLRAMPQAPGPLDIVHPEIYEGNLDDYKRAVDEPTLRFCLRLLGRWSRRQARRLMLR